MVKLFALKLLFILMLICSVIGCTENNSKADFYLAEHEKKVLIQALERLKSEGVFEELRLACGYEKYILMPHFGKLSPSMVSPKLRNKLIRDGVFLDSLVYEKVNTRFQGEFSNFLNDLNSFTDTEELSKFNIMFSGIAKNLVLVFSSCSNFENENWTFVLELKNGSIKNIYRDEWST